MLKMKGNLIGCSNFCNYSAQFPFDLRHPRAGGDPGGDWAATRMYLSHAKRRIYRWIPACAGMTKKCAE
jgi:hypothetical protein